GIDDEAGHLLALVGGDEGQQQGREREGGPRPFRRGPPPPPLRPQPRKLNAPAPMRCPCGPGPGITERVTVMSYRRAVHGGSRDGPRGTIAGHANRRTFTLYCDSSVTLGSGSANSRT